MVLVLCCAGRLFRSLPLVRLPCVAALGSSLSSPLLEPLCARGTVRRTKVRTLSLSLRSSFDALSDEEHQHT